MTLNTFIFDLDGVLADTTALHYLSWKQLADDLCLPFTRPDYDPLRGVNRRVSLERFLRGAGRAAADYDEATLQAWMLRKNAAYRASLAALTPADRLPGVTAFLTAARAQGIRLGIGSSSENAREVLARLELTPLFDAIGDGHSVVNSKPAPDIFLWVAGRLDASPARTVVFEDAEAGITAARFGGFWTVGITSGTDGTLVRDAHVTVSGLDTVTPDDVLARLAPLAAQRADALR